MIQNDLNHMKISKSKGGLFSENFSIRLKSPKMGANPSHENYSYPPKKKMIRGVVISLDLESVM